MRTFQRAMLELCGIKKDQLVIAAVSGGPDSLCLANLLLEYGFEFIIAHYDHGIRQESVAESKLVQNYAQKIGIECVLERGDVPHFALENHYSLEEAARELRYQFLYRVARKNNASAITLGHTADDQVETVLMHFLRGSGLDGLKGMAASSINNKWDSEICLIRPLLGTWRPETEEYCRTKGLIPTTDLSNQDAAYQRNRIRMALIPALETYNPQIKTRILIMSEILRGNAEMLSKYVDESWHKCVVDQKAGLICLDLNVLNNTPLGIQREVVRKSLQTIKPHARDIEFAMVEKIIEAYQYPPKSGRLKLPHHIDLKLKGKTLLLSNPEKQLEAADFPQLTFGESIILPVPGQVELSKHWELIVEIVDDSSIAINNSQSRIDAYLALRDANPELLIRKPKPGDRMIPLGMCGHSKKISDIFLEKDIDLLYRKHWPLVCQGEEVIWLPGFRIAESVDVSSESRFVFRIVMRKTHSSDLLL